MSELIYLPNIGKVLEQHLLAIGIETEAQLKEIGAQHAFLLISQERHRYLFTHAIWTTRSNSWDF